MTRPAIIGTGLPGPGQEHFPEQARGTARALGLYDTADLHQLEYEDDGAGASYPAWTEVATGIPARIDQSPTGSGSLEQEGGQLQPDSTHILSLEPGTTLEPGWRVTIAGREWDVLSVRSQTDELLVKAEVKEQ